MTFPARFNPSKLLSQWSRGFSDTASSKITSLLLRSTTVPNQRYQVSYDKDLDGPAYMFCRTCMTVFENKYNSVPPKPICPNNNYFNCKMVYVIGPNDDLSSSPFKKEDAKAIRMLIQDFDLFLL